jgi:F-type H+-transporting ATPase subunit gamma
MAGGKDIRSKIGSIQNTQKITRAMEMVAASKMRRAQDRMQASRPYAQKIRQVIYHLADAQSEYRHTFMEERETKRVGFIVVSTDRGLCGGLNTNEFRAAVTAIQEWKHRGVEYDLCVIGQKAAQFFRRLRTNVVAQATNLGDQPSIDSLIGTVKVMVDAYESGTVDRVYLVYNEFVNTMTQRPRVELLLPIHSTQEDEQLRHHWDYIYEPDAREVLTELLFRYIESLVYQAVIENNACEQAARRVAMKSATDNASEIIGELRLAYNKARQAMITQEIAEIVGGAAAL